MNKLFEIIRVCLEIEDGKLHRFLVSPNLARHIRYLREQHIDHICEIGRLKHENEKLKTELECIKPIIEKKELEPAISNRCDKCRFAVRSKWNNEVLGCCRKSVCEYYSPRE